MKRNAPLLAIVIFLVLGNIAWGECPEPNDRGECDTMYIEPWPDDTLLEGDGPYFIRVPIYVTNDVVNDLDSIIAFTIPLCYTHSNPSKYCSLTTYWNNTYLYPFPPEFLARSIFRHLGTAPADSNRMMTLSEKLKGWDAFTLNLGDETSRFWFTAIPLGMTCQLWWEGDRVLLATMTFKVEDHMQICIDTCFWPPSNHLAWGVFGDDTIGTTKIPRSGTGDSNSFEVCFDLRKPHFTIEAIPDTQTVQAGQSTDYDVILTSLFGFASSCTLTAMGLPDDASADFDPNPVTPTDTSLMTISTAETTPSGTHDITITATELAKAQIEDSTQVVLIVMISDVREIESPDEGRPSEFSLSQNYPNPFNPLTNFQFSLSKLVHVKIDIFNIVGQKVRTLVDEEMEPGVYVADWDSRDENGNFVSTGIYFYRMQAGDFSDMKKMLLLK